jgi:hypothetical protein
MIKFFTLPAPSAMQVYNGETSGKAWDDASYSVGLPTDWAANNTEASITKILQAKSSGFAFSDTKARASYVDAVSDSSNEVMIVLKGIHQYKAGTVGAIEAAHITIAWFTYLYHMNVSVTGVGSGVVGVAPLGVRSVTAGVKAVSSEATGWTTVKR